MSANGSPPHTLTHMRLAVAQPGAAIAEIRLAFLPVGMGLRICPELRGTHSENRPHTERYQRVLYAVHDCSGDQKGQDAPKNPGAVLSFRLTTSRVTLMISPSPKST